MSSRRGGGGASAPSARPPRDDVCHYYNTAAGCHRGDTCKFRHVGEPAVAAAGPGSLRDRQPERQQHRRPERIVEAMPASAATTSPIHQGGKRDTVPTALPATAAPAARPTSGKSEYPQTERNETRGGRGPRRDEYGAPIRGKNTENFEPCHDPPCMRIVVDTHPTRMSIPLSVRDVSLHPCIFTQPGDELLYDKLVSEIDHCRVPQVDLLKSWHGDSHWIADDSTGWKRDCPTFTKIIDRVQRYFNMDIKATRFNWYKNTSEWKPFHHDAAAVKPDKARTQNFTVGVSFGATRDAAFEEVDSKKVIAFPLTHGSVYCFSRDTNILWKHGILQDPPEKVREEGRISIIAWGWVDQYEV